MLEGKVPENLVGYFVVLLPTDDYYVLKSGGEYLGRCWVLSLVGDVGQDASPVKEPFPRCVEGSLEVLQPEPVWRLYMS